MNASCRIGYLVWCGSAVALALGVAGCAEKGLPSSVTTAYEEAFSRDDLPATMALFADDAQILPEHGPVVAGREAIEQFLKDQMAPVISYNTETEMTLVRRDLGIEQGRYRVRDVRRGSDVEEGKYLHIWRKINGEWKLYRVIYNTDVAPATEVLIAPAPEAE